MSLQEVSVVQDGVNCREDGPGLNVGGILRHKVDALGLRGEFLLLLVDEVVHGLDNVSYEMERILN